MGPLLGGLGVHVQCHRAPGRPAAPSWAAAAPLLLLLLNWWHLGTPHPHRLVLGVKLDVERACAISFDATRLRYVKNGQGSHLSVIGQLIWFVRSSHQGTLLRTRGIAAVRIAYNALHAAGFPSVDILNRRTAWCRPSTTASWQCPCGCPAHPLRCRSCIAATPPKRTAPQRAPRRRLAA